MHLRYALLALLAEGEAHGYELLKRFNERLGPFWQPNIGQVYQLLHELERRGLASRRDETVGTRLRRLFRLRSKQVVQRTGTRIRNLHARPAVIAAHFLSRILLIGSN